MSDQPATTVPVSLGPDFPLSRTPALTMAVVLSAGILCDRLWNIIWPVWAGGTLVVLLIAVHQSGRSRSSTAWVLLLWFFVGGARFHWVWSMRQADDLARFATENPQPVELIGTLASAVEYHVPEDDPFTPPWMREVQSTCTVKVEQLLTGVQRINVSGIARLEVSGRLEHARVGDPVRIVGRMAMPGPPGNPGDFDFRAYLRQQGIDCLVRSKNPEAVTVLPNQPDWATRLAWRRQALRENCRQMLSRYLRPEHVPVAASLLIGDRTGLTYDVQRDFAESGTMHLLAISGLHVGILAGLVFIICRLLNAGPWGTAFTVLVLVWLYAFVANHRPPVLRASMLVTVFVIGSLLHRSINGINALAVAAVLMLLWSPADLFDVGGQLSFLAVAAIVWWARMQQQWFPVAVADDPLRPEPGPVRRWLGPPLRWLRAGYLITLSIWLFTLPLVMARFHLASPIGFCLNVVLIPFAWLTLASGFLLLAVGNLLPFLAPAVGFVFDRCLGLLMWTTDCAAAWEAGHVYVSGPRDWWLIVYYACLGIATRIIPTPVSTRRAWQAFAAWTILGLSVGFLPHRRDALTCTFLDVGHGGAILVECPNGRTLLYDAGTYGNGRHAQQVIQQAMWARGLYKVDVLIISHADVDHFNGAAGLLETIRVDEILFHRSFLDFDQGSVVAVCESAARHGVPLRLVRGGDRLQLDPDVELLLLHPADDFEGDSDNENSNVLQINYAGRSILLTGDLDGAGLNELLNTPPRDVDVMLSPHHGSRAANPPELTEWARPEFVVISTGNYGVADRLSFVYDEDCRVLSTRESGAVTVRVSAEGGLEVRGFRGAND